MLDRHSIGAKIYKIGIQWRKLPEFKILGGSILEVRKVQKQSVGVEVHVALPILEINYI